MKHCFPGMACIAVLAAGLPLAAAADWNPAAIGHDLSSGQASQALKATRSRLAAKPADPQAQFLHAMALAQTGDVASAVDAYRELSAQYPQRARVWNNLGVLYARQGRLQEARDALVQATEAESSYATAQQNLGDVYIALASNAYRRAEQEGANADAMKGRRSALERLVPALPSTAQSGAGSSRSSAPSASDSPIATRETDSGAPARHPAPAGPSHAIDQVLSRWANAWSQQDLSAYLSVYSDDYQPQGKTSRAQWIRQQRVQITQPKSVDVSVSDVQVTAESADRARATFHEHYRAAGDDRDATKHMVFVREDGAWRIRQES